MMMMMQLESMIGDDNSHQTTDQLVTRTKNNLFKIVAHSPLNLCNYALHCLRPTVYVGRQFVCNLFTLLLVQSSSMSLCSVPDSYRTPKLVVCSKICQNFL